MFGDAKFADLCPEMSYEFLEGDQIKQHYSYAQTAMPNRPCRFPTRFSNRTRGCVKGPKAWVYVCEDGNGWIKIGITSDLSKRIPGVRSKYRKKFRVVFSKEVVPSASLDVETEALNIIGGQWRIGETAIIETDVAIAAVEKAFFRVGRYRHVDPFITEEKARMARIRACNQNLEELG